MISVNDINNKKFKTGLGYNKEEVDQYLNELARTIQQLSMEKNEVEKKMDVLADKVRDFMKDEDALKAALLGAQRQGYQIVDDAKLEATKVIAEANVKAEQIINSTRVKLEAEKTNLANMQKEVSDFKAKLLSLYKSHLDLITAIPETQEIAGVKNAAITSSELQQHKSAPQVIIPQEPVHTIQQPDMQINKQPTLIPAPTQGKEAQEEIMHSFPYSNSKPVAGENAFSDLKFGNNQM